MKSAETSVQIFKCHFTHFRWNDSKTYFVNFFLFLLSRTVQEKSLLDQIYYLFLHILNILRFRIKCNMAAIWIFSCHAVFGDFSTPKTKSGFGIKLQNWINLSSGTGFLSLPKLLTEIWPFKPHF